MAAPRTFGPVYRPPTPPVTPPVGPYGSTSGAVKPGPVLKPTKPPVKVTVHPDGKVEVHHNPTAAAAPTKPKPAAAPAKKPAPRPVVAPQTVEQQAQGLLDPVKKAILDAINQRVGAEQGAITSYSKDLAGLMGSYAPASRAAYGNAEVGQASVDAATQATLSGQGQAGANELAANLAKINADPGTAARLNAQAGSNVTGAVGALAGRGSASLSDLISRSASAQDYGAKLPGVAGLYGLQATKSAQSKATTDTANAVATLEGQYPGLVTSLKQNQQQQSANETTRALAAVQALGAAPSWAAKILGVPPGTTSAQIQAAQTRADATKAAATTRAAATKAAAKTRAATNAAQGAKPNSSITHAINDGYLYDSTGNRVLRNGQPVKAPKTGAASASTKPLTVPEKGKATADAFGIARNGLAGKDGKGNDAPKLNVGQAWDQMKLHGLLADPRTKAISVKALVQTYGAAGVRFIRKQGISK